MSEGQESAKRPDFVFGAIVATVVMLLIAATLYLHAYQTKLWVEQIKTQAAQREHATTKDVLVAPDTPACPVTKPVLIGFDSSGKPVCRSMTTQGCPEGQYISSIDPATLDVHCSDAGGAISCPAGSYITEFMWLGEGHTSFSCLPRLDPFLAWKFEPTLGSKGND